MSTSKDWFCPKNVIEGMTDIKQVLLDAEILGPEIFKKTYCLWFCGPYLG